MRFLILFFVLTFPVYAFSQDDDEPGYGKKPDPFRHCGIGFQYNIGKYEKPNTVTLEFVKKFGEGYIPTAFRGQDYRLSLASIGMEVGGYNDQTIIGPKLTYEVTWVILAARSEFTWYTNFTSSDPRLSIGGGISIFGWLGVYYVYQFQLSKHRLWEVNDNKFSFTIRYPFGLPDVMNGK